MAAKKDDRKRVKVDAGGDYVKVQMTHPDKDDYVGDTFVAKFTGLVELDGSFGPFTVANFERGDGIEVSMIAKAGLVRQLKQVEAGDDVEIVYDGMKTNPKTKREYHHFDVYRLEA